jgi:hypothetical protein
MCRLGAVASLKPSPCTDREGDYILRGMPVWGRLTSPGVAPLADGAASQSRLQRSPQRQVVVTLRTDHRGDKGHWRILTTRRVQHCGHAIVPTYWASR